MESFSATGIAVACSLSLLSYWQLLRALLGRKEKILDVIEFFDKAMLFLRLLRECTSWIDQSCITGWLRSRKKNKWSFAGPLRKRRALAAVKTTPAFTPGSLSRICMSLLVNYTSQLLAGGSARNFCLSKTLHSSRLHPPLTLHCRGDSLPISLPMLWSAFRVQVESA